MVPEPNGQFLLVMSPNEFARISAAAESVRAFRRATCASTCGSCIPAPSTAFPINKAASFCRTIFAGNSI